MTFDLVSYTRTPFRMSNDYKKKLIRTRYSTAVNDYQKRGIVALREKNAVLRAELARRDEIIAELEAFIRKHGGMLSISRRDEVIRRLKEDAERLAAHETEIDCYRNVYCVHCGNFDHNDCGVNHATDCPIRLHEQLMKELENEIR